MRIASWGIRNPVPINLVMLIVLIVGAVCGALVRREMVPRFDIDEVWVTVDIEGSSTPDQVDRNISQIIQPRIQTLDGVKQVTAKSTEQRALLRVELSRGYETTRVKNDIRDEIDRIDTLPEEALDPKVTLVSIPDQAVQIAIFGEGATARQLREAAEKVKSDLRLLGIASKIKIYGEQPYEIAISLSPERLRAKGLSIASVAEQVKAYNLELTAGEVQAEHRRILVKGEGRRTNVDKLRDIPIHFPNGEFLTLAQLAGPQGISDAFNEYPVVLRYNNRDAAILIVERAPSEDIITLCDGVRDYVVGATLPYGLQMETLADMSVFVRERLDLIIRNGAAGLLLVLLVLSLFLEWRIAFWASTGIAFSMVGSLAVLLALGHSINMLTLFGFLMTTGIVVDDAVVVGESYFFKRERGMSGRAAALAALQEVSWPVVAMMLTTIVAFAPLLFVSGIWGKFLAVLPIVTISAMVLSLFESLFILPVHLAHHSGERETRFMRALHFLLYPFIAAAELLRPLVDRGLNWFIKRLFVPIVHVSLKHRYSVSVCFLAILVFLFGLIPAGIVRTGLAPKVDSDVHMVSLELEKGVPVERTAAVAQRIVDSARTVAEQIKAETGVYPLESYFMEAGVANSHTAKVVAQLISAEDGRDISGQAFVDRWRHATGTVHDLQSISFSAPTGGPDSRALEILLSARDDALLEQQATQLQSFVERIEGAVDVSSSNRPGTPTLEIRVRDSYRGLPVTEQELIGALASTYFGVKVDTFYRGDNEVKMWVRAPRSERLDLNQLRQLRLPTGMTVEQVAQLDMRQEPAELLRIDGNKTIKIVGDVDESTGASSLEILAKIQRDFLDPMKEEHPDINWQFAGESKDGGEASSSMLLGLGPAMLFIYLILATVFKSYLQPIVIMSAIPFGLVGAISGHWIMGIQMNLLSGFGVIALTGIAVNDSLVLLDCINMYGRRRPRAVEASILIAAKRRFRPILLTSLTTTAGMAPILFEKSFQAQFLIPMVTSIVFGILFSTFLILVLVPVAHRILLDITQRFERDDVAYD